MLKDGHNIESISKIQFNDPSIFSEEIRSKILREIASILRADKTIVSSDFEKRLLIESFSIPESKLFVAPFYYPRSHEKQLPFHRKKDFIFIGNFRHPPNKDAVLWLKHKVWHKISKALPDATLRIYGESALSEDFALNNQEERFIVKGQLKPQFLYSTLSKHRINLAPLRYGAGIKGKITDGWYSGTPCVSTSIGLEGMNDGSPWGGLVADNEDDFAEAAIKLYTDEVLWNECKDNGDRMLDTLFNEEKNGSDLKNFLNELMVPKERHDWIKDIMWMSERRYTEEFGVKVSLREEISNLKKSNKRE